VKFAGIEKNSLVDYPGHMAAVFFTPGCNWRCFYCHNHDLVARPQFCMDGAAALDWLEGRRGWLDAVVITGGEPTLHTGLADFIRAVRGKGFKVKLDTNGTRPEVLRMLLRQRLLDYVAIDIKAPLDKYEAVCGAPVDHGAVNASIDQLLAGAVDYEFRTTIVPQLTPSDVLAIARRIRGARLYVLQQFRRDGAQSGDPRLDVPAHEPDWPIHVLDQLRGVVARCETRGFNLAQPAAAVA
jgi:pyruvate formate lyase activating enzyme